MNKQLDRRNDLDSQLLDGDEETPLQMDLLNRFVESQIDLMRGKCGNRLNPEAEKAIDKLIFSNSKWRLAYQNLVKSKLLSRKSATSLP